VARDEPHDRPDAFEFFVSLVNTPRLGGADCCGNGVIGEMVPGRRAPAFPGGHSPVILWTHG